LKCGEVESCLIKVFPDLIIHEVSTGLPYYVAGEFAHYLLEAYKNNSIHTLFLAGKFIEDLYSYEDGELDNLATVGYLEAIQNVWGNNSANPEEMVKYLGAKSQRKWVKLNDYWSGETSFCPLLNGEIYQSDCYDVQMVCNNMISEDILDFPLDRAKAKELCAHCSYNQLPSLR